MRRSCLLLVVLLSLALPAQAERGWLGVQIDTAKGPKALEEYGFAGVRIQIVFADGAAEAAGLLEGDIVLSINGQRMVEANQMVAYLQKLDVGADAVMEIGRDGEVLTMAIALDGPPKELLERYARYRRIAELAADVRGFEASSQEHLRRDGLEGLRITVLDEEGPGLKAGLRLDDRIVELERKPINWMEDWDAQAEDENLSKGFEIGVLRQGVVYRFWIEPAPGTDNPGEDVGRDESMFNQLGGTESAIESKEPEEKPAPQPLVSEGSSTTRDLPKGLTISLVPPELRFSAKVQEGREQLLARPGGGATDVAALLSDINENDLRNALVELRRLSSASAKALFEISYRYRRDTPEVLRDEKGKALLFREGNGSRLKNGGILICAVACESGMLVPVEGVSWPNFQKHATLEITIRIAKEGR